MNELEPIKIRESHEVVPIYKGGAMLMLSRREQLIADEFVKTRSFSSALRALKPLGWTMPSLPTIQKWLDRPHVKHYMAEQMKDLGYANGYTKERYKRELIEITEGDRQADASKMFAYKLLGVAIGIQEGPKASSTANVQINLTQANGRD